MDIVRAAERASRLGFDPDLCQAALRRMVAMEELWQIHVSTQSPPLEGERQDSERSEPEPK